MTIAFAGAVTLNVGVVSRVIPSVELTPVSLADNNCGVTGAGGAVIKMKLTLIGCDRLPFESLASSVSVCLPSATGPPLIVARRAGVIVNVVPVSALVTSNALD